MSSVRPELFCIALFCDEDNWFLDFWIIAGCTACLKAEERTFLGTPLFGRTQFRESSGLSKSKRRVLFCSTFSRKNVCGRPLGFESSGLFSRKGQKSSVLIRSIFSLGPVNLIFKCALLKDGDALRRAVVEIVKDPSRGECF